MADEDIVVTITHFGYIKRLPVTTYKSQRRGGRGITALHTKEEDLWSISLSPPPMTTCSSLPTPAGSTRLRGFRHPGSFPPGPGDGDY